MGSKKLRNQRKSPIQGLIDQILSLRKDQILGLAKAFLDEHGINPSNAVLCERTMPDGQIRWWFESKVPTTGRQTVREPNPQNAPIDIGESTDEK